MVINSFRRPDPPAEVEEVSPRSKTPYEERKLPAAK